MPNVKPWLTTDDLVEAVKLTMSFPLSQNSFTYNNIVTFLNQELQLNAVPTLLEEHQEYLVYRVAVPLVSNISRYPIPDRAIGMTLRDVKFADQNGNFYDITRIAPDDKAFFQQSNGSNQTVGKFYLEGNEMVLTPQLLVNPTGYLILFFHLRPNYLVRNEKAAIIQRFYKSVTILDNSQIIPGDQIQVMVGNQSPSPTPYNFTAVNSFAQTITSVNNANNIITTVNPHGFPIDKKIGIVLSGVTGLLPNINGQVISVTSTGTNTLEINNIIITNAGTGGSYSVPNQFVIGSNAVNTSNNLINTVVSLNISGLTAVLVNNSYAEFQYSDVSNTFTVENTAAFELDNVNLGVQFDQLDGSYTDPDTDEVSTLYQPGCLVDFLQTKPGHRTYAYDVTLVSINGTKGKFPIAQLQNYMSNSNGGVLEFYPIKVGDYICLQNECIIPQIPPELHHALAERAASRVLMAIGDKEGYAVSIAKIQEMDKKQQTLIGSRVESSVPKVFNRYSLLRLGKSRFRRRY